MHPLFIAFVVVPIVEMYILIQVGSWIGAFPTILLVVLTATVGIWLLRLEGLATLTEVQKRLERGEIPGQQLLEGIMLIIGGALLLTPGFVTDAIGFICLLPGLRKPIARYLIDRGVIMQFKTSRGFGGNYSGTNGGPDDIIDGEFSDLTKRDTSKHPGEQTPNDPMNPEYLPPSTGDKDKNDNPR